MRSDWILDVLSDLKQFAKVNNLPILAEQLDDTAVIALSEIASKLEKATELVNERDSLNK